MGLHYLDLLVIAAYLAAVTLFGISFRKRAGTLRDYFLGGRQLPWWAISLSIVAAETSVLTIISTPGLSYAGDLTFLQLVLGYLLGRIVIVVLLLPHYFRGELYTAYQLIERRFGVRLQRLCAAVFLVGRALAEGVRLFAISIVVGVIAEALPALGIPLHLNEGQIIAVIAFLTLLYTMEGGLRAVIWTDCIQIAIYLTGALLSFFMILHAIPGGWPTVAHFAAAHHKFRVFNFHFSWRQPYTFAAGLIGGMFLTTATDGADQLMVQRLLAARSERASRWALLSSWGLIFFQFLLFLLIGVLLAIFYRAHPLPAAGAFGRFDRLYPEYIAHYFPAGLGGLMIAAILSAAMSNLSAALNSLSSTTIMDFYRVLAPGHSERHYVRLSRLATVFWTIVLGLVAYGSRHSHSVLESGLSIISYPFSALLGVFLLGTLSRRATEGGAMAGMALGLAAALWLSHEGLPFTWFIAAGTLTTFASGWLFSLLRPAAPLTHHPEPTNP